MPGDDLQTKLDQHNGLLKVHNKQAYIYDADNHNMNNDNNYLFYFNNYAIKSEL